MKTSIIELSKIIFCQESKKYQIIFMQSDYDNFFVIYLANKYANNSIIIQPDIKELEKAINI